MSTYRSSGSGPALPSFFSPARVVGLIILGFVVVVALLTLHASYVVIEQTEVGVVTHWGQADPKTLGPGGHWINPWGTNVYQFHVGTQTHTFKTVTVYTKEQQALTVSGIVTYNIDARRAVELYSQYRGTDFAASIFDPAFQSYIKSEIATVPASDVQQSRPAIERTVGENLTATFSTYGIDVRNVFVNDMHFDAAYQKAVEDKQIAVQNAGKETQNVAVHTAQAQQAVADAEGQKQVKIKQAEADAQANALRAQNLTPQLIQFLETQNQGAAIAKWNGALPTTEVGSGDMNNLLFTRNLP